MTRWNENMLTETKNRNAKIQKQWYEQLLQINANNQPVILYNESTTNAAFFVAAAHATTFSATAAASAVDPDVHFISSVLKLDTELFSKRKHKEHGW